MSNLRFPISPSSLKKERVEHSSRMNEFVLQPPNSQLFSDHVIGRVVERVRTPQRPYAPQNSVGTKPLASYVSYQTQLPDQGETKLSSLNTSTKFPTTQDQFLAMAQLAISEKLRLRELRRMRQIRYRKKKEGYALSLEEEVGKLRHKIEKLEQCRRSVSADVPAEMNAWSVVAEYFRLFRCGMHEDQFDAQLLLRASFTAGVAFNSLYGVDKLVQYWQQMSRWFPSVEMELVRLHKESTGTLTATTVTTISISMQTIRDVFPHLTDSDGNESCGLLADKLLGQKITLRGSMHFEWDNTCHRISRVMSQSDMLTPMLYILGNLEDTARVFQGAFVAPNFQVAM
ncbi:hypothetical protein F443_15146 [Phytophthora nicotianae P1569]|uniref:BZIP domain-containing protein n=1 Tax=Phytophthora nicotianae P1569 TaxID=1317065 RepID=V9EJX7_PHYNI|nr:hypothetical protein F443_15146 [Phytophthora nicotianae P1569]